ncbi:hypothetical protein P0D84_48430 [Paraburkholderia sp. RL17-337-BIB-A]|uniref:hypothetical protein n=1 Tax=Paraburkholderia sp. RL17-337-BIB-A TaxID=3031636 RepID=UPI0038B7AD56
MAEDAAGATQPDDAYRNRREGSVPQELGAHTWVLDAVPIEKQRAYAQRIHARRPAKVRELKESTRTLS